MLPSRGAPATCNLLNERQGLGGTAAREKNRKVGFEVRHRVGVTLGGDQMSGRLESAIDGVGLVGIGARVAREQRRRGRALEAAPLFDAKLLYELGWIFQHKMGTDTDQAHMYYKRAWASEMDALFHGPRPDYAVLAADTNAATAVRLRDEYKMDPALMEQVDELYGPLDWRLPQAHAIYWAWQSKQVAEGFDAMAANRMIFQSLADAFRKGRLFVSKDGSRFIPSPNIDLIPRVDQAFQAALTEHPGDESLTTAHANFLREAVTILFTYNRIDQARALYDDVCARYPSEANGATFGDFVLRSVGLNSPALADRDAAAVIEGLLYQSLYWQALGDSDRAEGMGQWAASAWNGYMSTREDAEVKERVGLPPLDDMRRIAAERVKDDLGM